MLLLTNEVPDSSLVCDTLANDNIVSDEIYGQKFMKKLRGAGKFGRQGHDAERKFYYTFGSVLQIIIIRTKILSFPNYKLVNQLYYTLNSKIHIAIY